MSIVSLIENHGVNPSTMAVILLRYNHMVWREPILNNYRIPSALLEDLYDDLLLIEVEPGTTERDFLVKEIQSELNGTRWRPECIPIEYTLENRSLQEWHNELREALYHIENWSEGWMADQFENLGFNRNVIAFDYKEDETQPAKRYICSTPHY